MQVDYCKFTHSGNILKNNFYLRVGHFKKERVNFYHSTNGEDAFPNYALRRNIFQDSNFGAIVYSTTLQ